MLVPVTLNLAQGDVVPTPTLVAPAGYIDVTIVDVAHLDEPVPAASLPSQRSAEPVMVEQNDGNVEPVTPPKVSVPIF